MSYELGLTEKAEKDYQHHIKSGNKKLLKKIYELFESIVTDPCSGIGKPEKLKYDLAGLWSRRINQEHRLVHEYNSPHR